ncbi:MAG: hypothetical protein SCH98_15330 [Deferrisomatales bacterium]|nr:hypothetical protein [Deferrisomatales bacterium]
MTHGTVRPCKLTIRLDDRAHSELAQRARAAGVPVSTLAHDLVVHGLDHPNGLDPKFLQQVQDLHVLVTKALAGDPAKDDLGARIDRVYAAVARTHKALEEADQETVVERLRPWLVRSVVFLDGLANLSLPDTAQYRRFHEKVEATTRQILAKLTEEGDA